MIKIKQVVLILVIAVLPLSARGGEAEDMWPSDSVVVKRPNYQQLHGLFAAQTALYAGSLYGLSKAWYKNPLVRFGVADDTHEWKQLDKVGHLYTSFQISRHTAQMYSWTGITRKQAVIYGAISGFFFQTPIEILDGFSSDYGFSPGDMVANLAGPALYAGQVLLWDEIRIQPKFSFHYTSLAEQRPGLLGNNKAERWLKDYNGQTYWFSWSPRTFFPGSAWPAWLCISTGYGIQDMVAGETDKSIERGFRPYRQYYLSLDVDLTKIKTRNKFVRTVGFLFNTLKVPAPALEFNRNGLAFRPFYF